MQLYSLEVPSNCLDRGPMSGSDEPTGDDMGRWFKKVFGVLGSDASERGFLVAGWLLAPVISFGIRQVGFSKMVHLLVPLPASARVLSSGVSVERAEALLKRAFHVAPGAGDCLPRAVVQYLLHLRVGPEPRFVIGVRKGAPTGHAAWTPDAHAWVEAVGSPREPEFQPILAVSPRSGLQRFHSQPIP